MQYTASTTYRTALPRSKRRRQGTTAQATAASATAMSSEGEKLWASETDPDTNETEVATANPIKIVNRLRITDENGTTYGTISLDANGRFYFDKGIISAEDVVAYGIRSTDVQTVTDLINSIIDAKGTGSGTIDNVEVTGTGNAISSATLSADGKKITLTKGITALTSHQDISGKSNTTHTHSVKINGATKTIAASGGTAVDLGTYLTEHQDISGKLDKSAWNVGRTTSQQTDWDSLTTNGNYFVMNAAVTNKPSGVDWYGQLLVLRGDKTDTITQLYFPYNGGNPVVRSGNPLKSGGSWNAWKSLAYKTDITSAIGALDVTDTAVDNKFVTAVSEVDGKISVSRATLTATNIAQAGKLSNATSGNADTATKLATARNIWGKSFDGSAAVSGNMSNVGNIYIDSSADYRRIYKKMFATTSSTALSDVEMIRFPYATSATTREYEMTINRAGCENNYNLNVAGRIIRFYTGSTWAGYTTVIDGSGRVGIGTSTPTERFHVVGNALIATGSANGLTIKRTNTSSGAFINLYNNNQSSNAWRLGMESGGTFGLWSSTDGTASIANRLTIDASGHVGIGTTSPGSMLHIKQSEWANGLTLQRTVANGGCGIKTLNSSGDQLGIFGVNGFSNFELNLTDNNGTNTLRLTVLGSNGNVGIGKNSPTEKLHVSGNILATGDVTAYSDRRLKSNITDLDDRGFLRPVEYDKDGRHSIGFVAQEVRDLYPEVVAGDEKEGFLSVNYGAITAILQKQIINQQKQIDELRMLFNKLMEE